MGRKTVTVLQRIKEDVSTTRNTLHNYSEELETVAFDVTKLHLDDIRRDKDNYHTRLMKEIRALTKAVNKAAREHSAAVKKYREFFVC